MGRLATLGTFIAQKLSSFYQSLKEFVVGDIAPQSEPEAVTTALSAVSVTVVIAAIVVSLFAPAKATSFLTPQTMFVVAEKIWNLARKEFNSGGSNAIAR